MEEATGKGVETGVGPTLLVVLKTEWFLFTEGGVVKEGEVSFLKFSILQLELMLLEGSSELLFMLLKGSSEILLLDTGEVIFFGITPGEWGTKPLFWSAVLLERSRDVGFCCLSDVMGSGKGRRGGGERGGGERGGGDMGST